MSVKIMGLVWDIPNEKIKPNNKYVLLAYADHANHEGKSIFPSVELISNKTGYHERSVQRITQELNELGYLVDDGQGPRGTNKWRIPLNMGGDRIAPLTSGTVQGDIPSGDIPSGDKIAPEVTTIKEPSRGDSDFSKELAADRLEATKVRHEAERAAREARGGILGAYLRFTPGCKAQIRREEIQSQIAVAFTINVKYSKWEEFIKFVDEKERETNNEQRLDLFINWLKAKKGFSIDYWPPEKMQEVWPQAFASSNSVATPAPGGGYYV